MGFFGNQLANVVEWEEYREDQIFWKWTNREIKKGSHLILRPGQDAIFLYNGKIEGIFEDEGEYDIESDIVPFLSTLKGFRFGFNSGMRAEVLFVNTKELVVRWGTKQPINLPAPGLPGGMPIRANGNFTVKVGDYVTLIDKIAGIKQTYTLEEIRDRVMGKVNPLLMKWISKEGKDMFNLQASSFDIGNGIKTDLDYELQMIGLSCTSFNIESVSYPEEIQRMQQKAASQSMVGDMDKYMKISMADGMENGGNGGGSSIARDMMGMQMGLQMGREMMNQMSGNNGGGSAAPSNGKAPKFCPECGTPTNGNKFCSECGTKLF